MDINFFAYSGLANAFTSFTLGFYILIRNFHSKIARAFFYFVSAIGFFCTFYFIWLLSKDAKSANFYIRYVMIGVFYIPTTLTHFSMLLTEKENRALDIVNILISVVFTSLAFSHYFISGVEQRLFFPFWPVPGLLFHVTVVHFFLNVFYSNFLLIRALKKAQGVKAKQIKCLLIGTFIGFFGGCTNYFLWYNIPIPPVLNFSVSIYMIILAYAIFRHRMLDPEEVLAIHAEKLALLGVISSSINHEIKNPLFLLQEYAGKLLPNMERKQISDGDIEVMKKMSAQISRISTMVAHLGEFGCPNRGLSEEVNIREAIENALFFVSQELKYHNIDVKMDFDSGLPKVVGDKNQFEEIFLNLIVNAYHAMPNGGELVIAAKTKYEV